MSHQRQGVIASFFHYYYKPICFQRRYLVKVICPGLRTHGCRETRQHCRISSLRFGPRHVKLRTTSLTRKQPQSWTAMNSGVESGQWLQPRASARSPSPFGPRCGESQTLWLAVTALSRTIPSHTQFTPHGGGGCHSVRLAMNLIHLATRPLVRRSPPPGLRWYHRMRVGGHHAPSEGSHARSHCRRGC